MFVFAIPDDMPTKERNIVPQRVRNRYKVIGHPKLLGVHPGYRLYALEG